jgi:hypothetical protein
MTANASPLTTADVDPAARSVKADGDGLCDVDGNAEVAREQVRRSGRDDHERCIRAGDDVDAALHHSVSAPGDDHVRARRERVPHSLRRRLALRHLVPDWIDDALARQRVPELGQAAAQGLAGMCDDRDSHGRRRTIATR